MHDRLDDEHPVRVCQNYRFSTRARNEDTHGTPHNRVIADMKMRTLLQRYLPHTVNLAVRRTFKKRQRTTSQVGQDFWVSGEVFNGFRGGYFVDVGAADGLYLSNTFLLEQRHGWSGICIEADPAFYADLRRVRKARCVKACVDSIERDVEFVQRGVLGGVIDAASDNKPTDDHSRTSRRLKIRTRTLASILDAEGAPPTIDYLSLDVEGLEDRILEAFPFEKYTFNCLTIERPKPGLRRALERHGYRIIKELPQLDVFYVHESFCDRYKHNMIEFWWKYRL